VSDLQSENMFTSGSVAVDMQQPHDVPPLTGADLALLIVQKRTFIGRAGLVGLIVGIAVAFLLPAHYESTVRLLPPEQQSAGNLTGLLAAMAGKAVPGGLGAAAASMLGAKTSGALVAELVHSRTIQDHIVEKFEFQKIYHKRYVEDARKKLDHRTSVSEDKKSGVITVVFEDTDRARAQKVAEEYTNELNDLLAQVSTSDARRQRIFLENRLKVVQAGLERAEKDFAAFASTNATLDIKEQTKAMVTAGAELQGQLIAAQAQLQSLQQIYTPENVRVRAAQARISELQRQLRQMAGTQSSTEAGGDALYPPLRKIPVLGVRWADLYRATQIQETVFGLLTEQYELAKVQEAKEIATLSVVDPPNWPEKKSWPPRGIVLGAIVLLALLIAIGWLVLARWWDLEGDQHPLKMLVQSLGNGSAFGVNRR
jgi:capsule polysaccharide export protein KpsE/RkpR